MMVAPKLMPILLCWPMTSEADVGVIAVEVEHSRQYSDKFCCRAIDGRRGAVWQNGVWHGGAYESKGGNWIAPCWKNCTQSTTFIDVLNVYGDRTVDVSTVWLVSAVATATWKSSHVPDGHAQLSRHKIKSVSISSSAWIGGLRLRNCVRSWISAAMHYGVIALFVSIVVSTEINSRNYFRSDPHT
jgi:hypothetical protein